MGKIKLILRNVDAKKNAEIEVDTSADIEKIKILYANKFSVDTNETSIQIKFGGKVLNDRQTVEQLELEDGDILQCNERSLGGLSIKFYEKYLSHKC